MFWSKQPESAKKKDNYKVTKKLGEGTYGVVKEVIHIPTKTKMALKAIKKKPLQNNPRALEVVQREMNLLRGLGQHPHRNIIKLFDTFETNDKFYLVFELATGGELFERISQKGRFTEKDAAEIVFEILDGICYLHSHNIVHRLYKTEDLDSDIVIADFGVANVVQGDDLLRTLCGSPAYAAPEVIRRTGHGRPADIWSIGVITFTVLMGYGPWYYCEDVPSMFEAITHGRWKFESPYVDNVSMEGRAFVKRLMQLNPKNRPTARQAMLDPWLVKYSKRANQFARKVLEHQEKAKGAAQLAAAAATAGTIPDRTTSLAAAAVPEEKAAAAPPVPGKEAPAAQKSESAGTVQSFDSAPGEEPVMVFTDEPFDLQQKPDSPFVDPAGKLFSDLVGHLDSGEVKAAVDTPVDDAGLPNLVVSNPHFDPRKTFKRAAKIIGTLKMMEKMEKLKVSKQGGVSDDDDDFVLAQS
ncbi:hypothetical protein HDU96_009223 [Phlyctochytrium bullatum]|nr:hypothetical protein HDU96_009223 [Phlyctochytrium bullatum]